MGEFRKCLNVSCQRLHKPYLNIEEVCVDRATAVKPYLNIEEVCVDRTTADKSCTGFDHLYGFKASLQQDCV